MLDRKQKGNILRWIIGGVCNHQICKGCTGNIELSRNHGLVCSGADVVLNGTLGWLLNENDYPGLNLVDRLLNKYKDGPPEENPRFYQNLSDAISIIHKKCLHYRFQNDNGYWERPEEPAAPHPEPRQPNVFTGYNPGKRKRQPDAHGIIAITSSGRPGTIT